MQKLLLICLITLLSIFSVPALAQQKALIKGRIFTSDGYPASCVNISLKGKGLHTITDKDGYYVINGLKEGNYLLKVSAVGLNTIEKTIKIKGSESVKEDFTLNISSSELREVNIYDSKKNKFAVKSSTTVARMPLSNLENPQSYGVIAKELLIEQEAFTMEDGLNNVTAIQKLWDASGRAGSGVAIFSLRGFPTGARLRNGLVGNVNAAADAANIERIEVIRGPSATLFGSSLPSYGGLVNRVTKMPYDTLGGRVTYAGGSYGLSRISADFNAPVNADKSVMLRVNTAYNSQQGFQDYGFAKSFFFAPSVSYKASDKLKFNFDAELFSGKGTGFQFNSIYYGANVASIGASSADQLKLNYNNAYQTNSLFSSTSGANIFGQMELKLNDQWKLQTNVSVNSGNSNGRTTYFYVVPNSLVLGPTAEPGADYLARMVWTPITNDRAIEIQPNLTGDFKIGSLRNRLTVGLDYYNYRNNTNYERFTNTFTTNVRTVAEPDFFDIIPMNGPIPSYNEFNEGKVAALYASKASSPYYFRTNSDTYSAYVADVLNITDQLLAMVGLRVDRFMDKPVFDAVSGSRYAGYNQTTFSPKFGLVYQVIKDRVSLFGNYQNGFVNSPGKDAYNKSFTPEQANQIEGGVKLDLFGDKLSGTISYYDIKVKDVIRVSTEPINNIPNARVQNGTQKSKGFEAELIANPIAGLNVIAGFAYNDSRYTNISAALDGRRPATSGPEYMANVYASYRILYGKAAGLGFGIGGNYAGKSLIINSVSRGTFALPEYTVLNANVFYEQRKFRFGLSANNITDKKYWIGYLAITPQMTRNYVASASFKF